MAVAEAAQAHQREMEDESEFDVLAYEDDSDDDSDDDPSYDIVEETASALSKLSVSKPRSRKCKEVDLSAVRKLEMEAEGSEIPKLDEKDEKSFEKVEELIKGGELHKLKIDQCKIYLRKYGLRLTGTKDILISRIAEHQEIINGGGEKKYPPESFVLNCKGDACLRDVVIFEQNVYEMYNIASRSATGPPCGTRTVAGRIVKESYGVAKQQHTFTIEVLWSTGVKPWPPLHPLLIKGRNLYRIKTMRQRWADEGERQKVLQEKHARGFCARSSRDVRIREKEMRKNGTWVKRNKITGDKENRQPQTADILPLIRNHNREQHKPEQDRTRSKPQISNNNKEQHSKLRSNFTVQQVASAAATLQQQPIQAHRRSCDYQSHARSSQAHRRSCDYQSHASSSQAPNWRIFGYQQRQPHHHSQGFQQFCGPRNGNSYSHQKQYQASAANQYPLHQQYPDYLNRP